MRISKILAAAVLALGLTACGDSLTAPEAVDQMQQEIRFPPSNVGMVQFMSGYTAVFPVLSLYAPAGIVPIAEAKVVGASSTLQMKASVTFSSQSDMICEADKCKVAWKMNAHLEATGEGEAEVVVSLKANPTETTRFRVRVTPSCYDKQGNYTCKG